MPPTNGCVLLLSHFRNLINVNTASTAVADSTPLCLQWYQRVRARAAPLFCPRVVSVYVYDLSGGDKRRVVGFYAARPDYRLRTQDALGRLAVRQQGRAYRASVVPTDPGATKLSRHYKFW